jgi:aryl-alcohol dehydrogenase-like predicted oxidoreductase
MQQRAIGRLGRSVSEIGFGGRRLDNRDTQRLLFIAIDGGVDVVDVAPSWSNAEELAGEAIRELRLRDRILLITQAPPDHRTVQVSIERSLRETKLDVIPLAMLTGWDDDRLMDGHWPELRETLERLIQEGKVLAWGAMADDDPRALRATLDDTLFTAVQVPFHVQDRRLGGLLPHAAERKAGVFVRRTLDGGLFDADTSLELALAEPAVSCALVGTHDLKHLRHNLGLKR